jgi:hypothetical protein
MDPQPTEIADAAGAQNISVNPVVGAKLPTAIVTAPIARPSCLKDSRRPEESHPRHRADFDLIVTSLSEFLSRTAGCAARRSFPITSTVPAMSAGSAPRPRGALGQSDRTYRSALRSTENDVCFDAFTKTS